MKNLLSEQVLITTLIGSIIVCFILFIWPLISKFVKESVGYRDSGEGNSYTPVILKRLAWVVITFVLTVLLTSFLYRDHAIIILIYTVAGFCLFYIQAGASKRAQVIKDKDVDSSIFWNYMRPVVTTRMLILFLILNILWVGYNAIF